MRPPFAVNSYQSRSAPVSAQRLINWFPEIQPQDAKSRLVLFGTPGLSLFATAGEGPVRAAVEAGGDAYVVSGVGVYKITSAGVVTHLGDVDDTTPVTMDVNRNQVIITTKPTMWVVTISTGVLTQVTDSDFPGASSVAVLDGYAIYTKPDTDQWGLTEINDATLIDGLDFATAESAPDKLVRVFVDHREAWLMGEKTIEIWYNAGGADFPFARVSGAHIETGCGAFGSISKIDNSLFWLGNDRKIYRAQGYQGQRVSTHAIEEELRKYSTVADAEAFSYNQSGHAFYCITFPAGGATWVFDAASSLWHERMSWGSEFWRPSCSIEIFNKVLVGDRDSGKIFTLDMDHYFEDGNPIVRTAMSPPVHADGKLLLFHELEVEFEHGVGLLTGQGVDPQAMLRWSDDDGATWSAQRWKTLGARGKHKARAIWRKCGSSRKRIYELTVSDPVKLSIIAADPYIEPTGGKPSQG